ncbi:hypothetical protein AgCh_021497 [Apium graveolens]
MANESEPSTNRRSKDLEADSINHGEEGETQLLEYENIESDFLATKDDLLRILWRKEILKMQLNLEKEDSDRNHHRPPSARRGSSPTAVKFVGEHRKTITKPKFTEKKHRRETRRKAAAVAVLPPEKKGRNRKKTKKERDTYMERFKRENREEEEGEIERD